MQDDTTLREWLAKGSRSLFLDRDGVINHRLIDDYVKRVDEFKFLPGVLSAMTHFTRIFEHTFIVTNQQGIAKGLMSEEDLGTIHQHMLEAFKKVSVEIDGVYYCPDFAHQNSLSRKPAGGMGYQAQRDFPELNFSNCLMVGDSASDMGFAHNLGMRSALILGKSGAEQKCEEQNWPIDFRFNSLKELSDAILS